MEYKKIEFIYWFAYYNLDSASVRYRGKYPLDYFKKKKGIEYYLILPGYKPKQIYLFIRAFLSALFFRKRNSLVVIQRVQSNFIYAGLLKLLVRIKNKDTVYDIDDADYLEVDPRTIYYFSKYCKTISAGSKQIETCLRRYNDNIIHITSPILDLGIVKTNKNPLFTIGWIGDYGGEHKDNLIDVFFPALKELKFQLKLILIGVHELNDIGFIKKYFQNYSNIMIDTPLGIDWNDEVDIQNRIVQFDVGIATLTDSEMQLSKSGIKAKQYMNNGVPVLSTNLPENNYVVIDGVNGYFCDTTNEFKERLSQIYEMTTTDYLLLSKNARESICNFDHDQYFKSFEKIKNIAY